MPRTRMTAMLFAPSAVSSTGNPGGKVTSDPFTTGACVQNDPLYARPRPTELALESRANSGSARAYLELSARLAISTTDEQAGGPGRMFMHGQRWA